MHIQTHSPDETFGLGEKLGKTLEKGDIVCLSGELGAGKTLFTKGIASALGVRGYVTSPTFTIVNEYEAEIPLYHFDAYRVQDPGEMFEIGFEEYLCGNGIVVIEWADLVRDILPGESIRVDISKVKDTDYARVFGFEFRGERYRRKEERLKSLLDRRDGGKA